MLIINTHKARTHFSRLLKRAAAGEEVIIAKAGRPVARLIGYTETSEPRTGGQWKGRVHIANNFDDPLPK